MTIDDAGVEEDYREEGEEQCPICGRTNILGEDDTCEHFAGLLCDAAIIWSRHFPRFEEAWNAVSSFLEERESEQIPVLHERAAQDGFDPRLIKMADPYECDPSAALQELVAFSEGNSVSTDGMLSGSGWSLYHAEPAVIQRLAMEYERLLPVLEVASSPPSSQEPS